MKRINKLGGITVTLLVVGLFFWYLTESTSFSQEHAETAKSFRPVPTASVVSDSALRLRSFPGSVRASSRVDIAFNVDGLLIFHNGIEGTKVKKGEILARLDDRDAQNAYDAAIARHEDALKNYKRSLQLMKQKVTHQSSLDSLKAKLDIAAAEKRSRQKALEDTVLRAPFDGVVAKRFVEKNQHIKGKDVILSLKNVSLIDIVIQVPENLIARGGTSHFDKVKVQFDAAPGKWYPATMREYSVQSDPVTRTYEVVVSLSPPKTITVLPGMTATVQLEQKSAAEQGSINAVFVPLRAVAGANDSTSYVWVIPPQGGTPEKREVTIGVMKKNSIQIISGLKPGELVAVAGVHSLRQDMQVRPAKEHREGLDR